MAKQKAFYKKVFDESTSIKWSSKNLAKIIRFYLIEGPAHKDDKKTLVSHRGKSFASYGWIEGHRFKKLKEKMLAAPCGKLPYYPCNNTNEVLSKLEELGSVSHPNEYCVLVFSKGAEINSILRTIRNALAHGSYYQMTRNNETIYFLQNHSDGNLKAEMALNEKTLLSWIDIIKAGPNV